MIDIQNVSKAFGKKVALNDVCLHFGPGVYGLLGPNGAGKTTLIRSIVGVYKIQKGDILINGTTIKGVHKDASCIGYLPQKFGLFKELTTFEALSYFATLKGVKKERQKRLIDECLEKINLTDRADDKVGSLSGGMIRRLGIGQALLDNPEILIVDEPTAGLDPEERARFKNLIATIPKTKTVIISTHIVEDVEAVCSDIVIMDKGKIIGTGDSASIRGIADGKVYHVSAQLESSLMGNYFVLKREQIAGENILRVLSATPQDGPVMHPTIEDGYMCRVKGLA